MNYDDVRNTIMKRIDEKKQAVIEHINSAAKLEDWEEIKDEIEFILQAHGAVMVIDHTREIGEKATESSN